MKRDVHYEVEEGKRTVAVSEEGVTFVEDELGMDNLYEAANTPLVGYLNNALKAKELFKRDRDYIVTDGEVLIVDEFTGRVLHGRRFNEGLHQALEAKEGVQVQHENQTLATITLQNYFRLYDKLSGMTGTAQTEAAELHQIYKLGVVPIPTNKPMVRLDETDYIFKSEDAKFAAVVDDIAERHEAGQPILVGTASVAKSERLASLLLRRGIAHEVLNAKQHAREAAIVAAAGRKGAVTVATNMAGRGTDIMLGGNPEFAADLALRERGLSPDETPEEYEAGWASALEKAHAEVAKEHDEVVVAGRAVRARHRAPRFAPHRQPAARAVRAPGRPGRIAVLPVARRRPDGQVQRRAGRGDDEPAAGARRRADRGQGRHQVDPVGAEPDGGAELRDPQGRAEVRRRPQQAAHRHLRRAAPHSRRPRSVRADPADDRVGRAQLRRGRDQRRLRRGMEPRTALDGAEHALPGVADDRRGARPGRR